MGILDRAIRRGVNRAVDNVVDNAVQRTVTQVVTPKVNQAADRAANAINRSTGTPTDTAGATSVNQASVDQAATTLGGIFGSYASAANTFANEAAQNMKICPACGEAAGKDVKFCPSCGAKLPETSVAQGAVCPSCGKQNSIGTRFCADCGAKLPSAVAEEQAAASRDAATMQQWDALLSAYPRWNCGGTAFSIEQMDGGCLFYARFASSAAAQNAVQQYRTLLQQNGFRTAGQYPDPSHLYKMVGGVCYHCDTEHCFDGDSDQPMFGFSCDEPTGGFHYVKPEPKKAASFRDLFGF